MTLTGRRGCQVQVEARAGSSRGSSRAAAGNASLGAAERAVCPPGLGHGGLPTNSMDFISLPQLSYSVMKGLELCSGCLNCEIIQSLTEPTDSGL